MNQWLCDTNVISELMRREPFPQVAAWLRTLDHVHLSVITLETIVSGLRHRDLKQKHAWFARFVASKCTILGIDERIARRAGETRGRLAARGIVRSQADMLIAATAWRHDLTLVTRNSRDFIDAGIPVLNPFEEA